MDTSWKAYEFRVISKKVDDRDWMHCNTVYISDDALKEDITTMSYELIDCLCEITRLVDETAPYVKDPTAPDVVPKYRRFLAIRTEAYELAYRILHFAKITCREPVDVKFTLLKQDCDTFINKLKSK